MEWSDSAIILNNFTHSDSITILSCLTKKHGFRKGAIRTNKKTQQIGYPGNLIEVVWRGRLEGHLGNFNIKSCEFVYPYIYNIHRKLLGLLSVCSMFDACLTEKEPQEDLYHQLENFVYDIKTNNTSWLKSVIFLETELLSKIGFGLDLAKCAVTNTKEDLTYLSPKTGKVVCKNVGEPYKDKLFTIPKIFMDYDYEPTLEEITYALSITKHFFEKHISNIKGGKLPSARSRLQLAL